MIATPFDSIDIIINQGGSTIPLVRISDVKTANIKTMDEYNEFILMLAEKIKGLDLTGEV